nr:MAG TPA: hypothetical protein [Caudoviricetes sp.]
MLRKGRRKWRQEIIMDEKEIAMIKELTETLMRLTPEKLNLFLSAAQELITQTQVQDDLGKYL